MKVTNYKISKRLKELGFEKLTNASEADVKAYDLETILDALPNRIEISKEIAIKVFDNSDIQIGLCYSGRGETLADTAARLLIKLIEDKIIEL
jgi:hypothetical protein